LPIATTLSTVTAGMLKPVESSSLWTALCTLVAFRLVGTTVAPAAARPSASAAPIPPVPPMMTATFSLRLLPVGSPSAHPVSAVDVQHRPGDERRGR
jgi:hypothetical protein